MPKADSIAPLVHVVRGERVLFDGDLASLYGVSTRTLNQAVKRNPARAIEVNIAIMRTFVQLRRLMDSNRQLARKIEAMEKKYDEQFGVVFDAIKRLIAEDDTRKSHPKRGIGFIS